MNTLIKISILTLALTAIAISKPVVTKILVPDTTFKIDTLVSIDTLIVTKHYRDTSVYVKSDSIKAKGTKIIRGR
jgi:hypothetical protein